MGRPLRIVGTLSFVVCGLLAASFLGGQCSIYCGFCPPPEAWARASATMVCAGEAVVLQGGPKNCRWFPAESVTNPLSCVTSAMPNQDSVFTVTAEDIFRPGCFVSAAVFIQVLKSPAPVVTAPGAASPGQAGLVASVPFHEGSLYEWSISNGGITSGQGTNAITFSAGPGPIVIGGIEVGVQIQVIEYPTGACRTERGFASVAIRAGSPPPVPTPTPTPRTRTLNFRN